MEKYLKSKHHTDMLALLSIVLYSFFSYFKMHFKIVSGLQNAAEKGQIISCPCTCISKVLTLWITTVQL